VAEDASEEPSQKLRIAAVFGGLLDASELNERLASGLGRRQSGAQVVVDVHLNVALKLVEQLAIVSRSLEQRSCRTHGQCADMSEDLYCVDHETSPLAGCRKTPACYSVLTSGASFL